jgi:hypothetical protein
MDQHITVLGINEGKFSSEKNLAQIRANLEGIDYIFLDEVSMLSCRDLYKISCQCAKARGEHNKPFSRVQQGYRKGTKWPHPTLTLQHLNPLERGESMVYPYPHP